MGGSVLGLRYADCAAALDVYGLNVPEVWDGLRIVETVYCESVKRMNAREKGRTNHG